MKKMKKIEIFKNGEDNGYLGSNDNWWFDKNHADSFELFDLDGFYSEDYFKEDHIKGDMVCNYVNTIKNYYCDITKKELKSVLEAGCAGGWFTKEFINNNIDVIALEGSLCGYNACLKKGISTSNIIKHDLRNEINLNKKFDICCCTEVAEHIETPFSSQLVLTLIKHSDLVWFSFEEPGTNENHYHHCNEQPEKFWVNIFDFYGYDYIKIPKEIYDTFSGRGTHLFYNKNKITI
jgi:hypothetical protein